MADHRGGYYCYAGLKRIGPVPKSNVTPAIVVVAVIGESKMTKVPVPFI